MNNGGGTYWWELPEVARKNDVATSPSSFNLTLSQSPSVFLTSAPTDVVLHLGQHLDAGRTGFIDEDPSELLVLCIFGTHVRAILLLHVGCLAILLGKRNVSERVECEATNNTAHSILQSQKHKLDAMRPAADLLEKLANPQKSL